MFTYRKCALIGSWVNKKCIIYGIAENLLLEPFCPEEVKDVYLFLTE